MPDKITPFKPIHNNLEALRGFAAVFVIIHHIIYNKLLDPKYFPTNLKYFEPPGHFCVYVFFVLSGYVIGISNKDRLTSSKILPYIKKRFLRIYPIYFISVTLALLIAVPYSFSTIISNYTITQGGLGKVITEINPIWSLNYEVLYYLIFIPISFFNIEPVFVLLASIVIGLINYGCFPGLNIPMLSSYSYGFTFWTTGLCIARYIKDKEPVTESPRLLSGMFLLLSYNVLSFFDYLLHKITFVVLKHDLLFPSYIYWPKILITFYDLAILPYCFLLVIIFSGKQFRYKKYFVLLMQILPFVTLFQSLKNHEDFDTTFPRIIAFVYFVISLGLYYLPSNWFNTLSERVINWGIKLGSISYGLYIIHFPILIIFNKISVLSTSLPAYIFRFVSYIIVCLLCGFILERKFQLWFVQLFKSKTVLISDKE